MTPNVWDCRFWDSSDSSKEIVYDSWWLAAAHLCWKKFASLLVVLFFLCPIKTWIPLQTKIPWYRMIPYYHWYHDTTQKRLGWIFNVNFSVFICSHSPPRIMLGFQEVPESIENSARKNSNKFLHVSFINKSSWINQKLPKKKCGNSLNRTRTVHSIKKSSPKFYQNRDPNNPPSFLPQLAVGPRVTPPFPPPLSPSGGCVRPPPMAGSSLRGKKSSNKEWHKNLR